jgi:hypothetical protein
MLHCILNSNEERHTVTKSAILLYSAPSSSTVHDPISSYLQFLQKFVLKPISRDSCLPVASQLNYFRRQQCGWGGAKSEKVVMERVNTQAPPPFLADLNYDCRGPSVTMGKKNSPSMKFCKCVFRRSSFGLTILWHVKFNWIASNTAREIQNSQLLLSEMSGVECWKLFNISVNNAVAIFRVSM